MADSSRPPLTEYSWLEAGRYRPDRVCRDMQNSTTVAHPTQDKSSYVPNSRLTFFDKNFNEGFNFTEKYFAGSFIIRQKSWESLVAVLPVGVSVGVVPAVWVRALPAPYLARPAAARPALLKAGLMS